MKDMNQTLRTKRQYGARPTEDGHYSVLLSDQEVTLSPKAWAAYQNLTQTLFRKDKSGPADSIIRPLRGSRLIYSIDDLPASVSGLEFHDEYFAPVLRAWLYQAFHHPFWEKMMSGAGSVRFYAGWLFELYHFTKNANRHMPLAAANCHIKSIKALFAKHYHEEWNHFHFFSRALVALGYDKDEIASSKPLPMTLEMSNFMREAARRDSLAYAICSAVLEGTTVDRGSFNPFYEAVKDHYGVPTAAVQPIYDHLDLDVKYQHSDLFRDICIETHQINAERASLIFSYGHQMVEHIWMWTENISSYYGDPRNSLPHMPFDIHLD